MKISPINTNYPNVKQNNKNFTARFTMNKDIKFFIDESSYENMLRFRDILTRMKKAKDNFVYTLERKKYTYEKPIDPLFDETETVTEYGFELSRQEGKDLSTKKCVAGFEDNGFYYRHSLGELNDRLEEFYPQRAGKVKRGRVTDEITKLMV